MGEFCDYEVHEQIKSDPDLWARQEFVGIQDGCGGPSLCLRNCVRCASTLAVAVEVEVMPDRRSAL